VSTVTVTAGAESALEPAPFVARAANGCGPSARPATGSDHVPSAAAVVVPTDVEPSKTSTVTPASAVPATVTVELAEKLPLAGDVMTGRRGSAALTVQE
jgi:hypothetical protein